jgi:hypothetical protein
MAQARAEARMGAVRTADLMDSLRSLITGLPCVKEACTEDERIAAVQRVTEACVVAYYRTGA